MANAMANESIFTNFKRELQTLNYAELNYLISDIMLEIKKRSYNEGMVKGMTSFGSAEEVAPVESEKATQKAPQQLRDEIVEKAKRDIEELSVERNGRQVYLFGEFGSWCDAQFIVNKDKRTIVVILRHKFSGIMSRGIAKCDPSDCFNAHIGKAIALRRALGLEVPTEYLNAPQPTEVRVGDVVVKPYWKFTSPYTVAEIQGGRAIDSDTSYANIEGLLIIDDSREGGDANGEG